MYFVGHNDDLFMSRASMLLALSGETGGNNQMRGSARMHDEKQLLASIRSPVA
jgi:hypothetical protein